MISIPLNLESTIGQAVTVPGRGVGVIEKFFAFRNRRKTSFLARVLFPNNERVTVQVAL
jgi:hypothetical protein